MDSKIGYQQQHCHQNNSGLMRYRSAPSSLLTSLVDCVNEGSFRSEDHQSYHPSSTRSSEMETMLARLISSNNNNGLTNSETLPVKQEHNGCYSYASPPPQIIYQPQQIQGLSMPNGSLGADAGNAFDGSFSAVSSSNSLAPENNYTQTKLGGSSSSNCSNLIRQKSSPAEFFSNYSVGNGGLAALREVGSFRSCDVSNGQATTSTSGLHGTLNFSSSRPSSCSTRMPQIAENEHEGLQENCVESRNMGNDNGSTKCYMPISFTNDFWDGSNGSNNGEIMFSTSSALETQDAEFGYQKLGLSHHLSLPSSSTKMTSMEKFLQIQGSVPCKIRAKRGFATHPRSIAERERRTRISSRIKKLQDLFPKSDKQASTADMLDLAVDYIKDLRKQVKILAETKAKCTCPSNQKQLIL